MAAFLQPSGCLTVASGVLASSFGPVNITISSVPYAYPASDNATRSPFMGLLTILHSWGPNPPPCVSPSALSGLRGNEFVVTPYSHAIQKDLENVTYSYSYTVGCNGIPFTSGNGSFVTQLYGGYSFGGAWTPIPFPYAFSASETVIATSSKDGFNSSSISSFAGDTASSVVSATCAATPAVTNSTTVAPSHSSAAPRAIPSLVSVVFLVLTSLRSIQLLSN
ncbi:hypothetical protein HDU83_007158 [Entophlyctis luteolus]|nr:hypothetical protein HDU83_007158 [Entophlyctis luteolus]KAJ3382942.1 hypothetical protein HDU84_003949 [Entophlyctis sp. JEL0112]